MNASMIPPPMVPPTSSQHIKGYEDRVLHTYTQPVSQSHINTHVHLHVPTIAPRFSLMKSLPSFLGGGSIGFSTKANTRDDSGLPLASLFQHELIRPCTVRRPRLALGDQEGEAKRSARVVPAMHCHLLDVGSR